MKLLVRVPLALVMVALAVPFAAYGGGTLRWAWTGEGDASPLTYVLIGLPLLGIAELAVAGGGDVSAKPFGLTPVTDLFAGFSFAGGTAILEQSRAVAPGFSADAKGWIALIDGSLGLNGTVQAKRPGAAVPPPMPFTIDGTLARPVARPLALAN